MKKYILFFNVLIMTAVTLAGYGQSTDTAATKRTIAVWFRCVAPLRRKADTP